MRKKAAKTVETVVMETLLANEEARKSNEILYFEVCKAINPRVANCSFSDVMLNRIELNLPTFQSVRCTRQVLQNKYPILSGDGDSSHLGMEITKYRYNH